jgi:hypothetical protein
MKALQCGMPIAPLFCQVEFLKLPKILKFLHATQCLEFTFLATQTSTQKKKTAQFANLPQTSFFLGGLG